MPVLIQEVIIRATVTERQPQCGDVPPAGSTAEHAPATGGGASSELIAEQIFEILKAKRER